VIRREEVDVAPARRGWMWRWGEVSVARRGGGVRVGWGRRWMWGAGEGVARVVRRGGEEVSVARRAEVIGARQGGGGECGAPGRGGVSRAGEDEVTVAPTRRR